MKFSKYLVICSFCIAALASNSLAKAPEGWETNVEAALELARKENKAVMLEFTGSDWCPPCIKMSKEVFSKEEFVKAASEDYILVHLDFPKKDKEVAEKNKPWLEKYKVSGFPTVVLLDSEGVEFTRFPATKYPELQLFLDNLKQALENKDLD
jgi:thioredoxin-related protein